MGCCKSKNKSKSRDGDYESLDTLIKKNSPSGQEELLARQLMNESYYGEQNSAYQKEKTQLAGNSSTPAPTPPPKGKGKKSSKTSIKSGKSTMSGKSDASKASKASKKSAGSKKKGKQPKKKK